MFDFAIWYVLAGWVLGGYSIVYLGILWASREAVGNANPLEVSVMRYWQIGYMVHGFICLSLIGYIFIAEIVSDGEFWYSFHFIFLTVFVLIDVLFAVLYQKWINQL